MKTIVATGILSISGSILAAWVTTRLTLRRFYAERIWERKVQAYSSIIESLHDMRQWYVVHEGAEFSERQVPAERDAHLREVSKEAEERMFRRLSAESWLLSSFVTERIQQMSRTLEERQETWFDHIQSGYAATNGTMVDLARLARHDLGLDPEPLWARLTIRRRQKVRAAKPERGPAPGSTSRQETAHPRPRRP